MKDVKDIVPLSRRCGDSEMGEVNVRMKCATRREILRSEYR